MAHIKLFVLGFRGSWGGSISPSGSPPSNGDIFLVDRRFLNSWSRCPFDVATCLGKCFDIKFVVKPGKEKRRYLRMARSTVDFDGLKRAPDKYSAISFLVLSSFKTLFVIGLRFAL